MHLIHASIPPLSNCKDTGEEPSSLDNSKHTKHTRTSRVQTQHSTVTTLNILNDTVANGFNQMVSPARTINVALDMSKSFDTINIHTLIRKLLQTTIAGTIIKLIAYYIKDAKPTQHTKTLQRQFGVLSPTLFNIYTSDVPPPRAPFQVMAYADDITITSTHTSTSASNNYIQPYLHTVFA